MSQSSASKQLEVKLGRTLQVHFPLGQTLGLTLLILVALGGSSEALARTSLFQRQFLATVSKAPINQFESKLAALQERVKQAGSIDCLLVGNSVAQWNLDMQTLDDAYQGETGHPLGCFNFAIDGLHPQSVAALIEYLIDTFHPQLIIYGLNDWFSNLFYGAQFDPIIDTPWFQYQRGHYSIAGWLSNQSYAYRYYPRLVDWWEQGGPHALRPPALNLNGDPPQESITRFIDVTRPPDPVAESSWFQDVVDYHLPPQSLGAFEQIATLKSTQVLIVEIPTHPSYALFYPNGLAGKEAAIKQIREFFESRDVPYWTTEGQPIIPDGDWRDRVHLWLSGAKLLSSWLGKRLAQATATGVLQFSRP